MNKHLLLGTALLVAISAYPQAGKITKPSGVVLTSPKKIDINESTNHNATAFTGPVKQVKNVTKSNAKSAGSIPSFRFTGSHNVFGYLVSQSRPFQYNKAINAISMIARKDFTYTPTVNGNSGSITGLWSTNLGTTWDETCMWADGANLGRYPQGGIYNPLGNANPLNAYLVGCGPITGGSGWLGNWYVSKQISSPGNTTPAVDMQAHLDASPTIPKHAMSRYSFNTTDGAVVRSMATILTDINGTTNLAYGLRGAAMVKGLFSAGAFVWSVDSFIPALNTRPADGSGIMYGVPVQAWDDAGVVGYVVILGSRAGTGPTMNGYQPIVYKTTNSGASWSLLPANDFADPVAFRGVYERMYPLSSNTAVICANFSGSEGFDVAVDMNGNLHYATMTYGHYSNHGDSLGYRNVFGTEQYSYGNTGPFDYPIIYDFYTKSTGGWGYHMVDSMGTEGPSGTSGQPGYGSNVWSDGSGGKMDQDARIQINRTDDGRKLFYSWSESDSAIVGLKWNIYPSIMMKGYDVGINMVTPRINVTTGDLNVDQGAYYQYMNTRAIGSSTSCVTIPFTVSKNATLDGAVTIDTYFLGDQVCPTAFSITPMSPTGIASTKNNVVDYDVINFPNPANGATTIIVGLKVASNFEVSLYSSVGQLITSYNLVGQVGSNQIDVNLSSLSAGIYFYNVKVGNSVVTKKLVVQ
jgi:hypothetical protein